MREHVPVVTLIVVCAWVAFVVGVAVGTLGGCRDLEECAAACEPSGMLFWESEGNKTSTCDCKE